ncbi:hypothetical protein Trydic_g7285 [Trypoxylus dichotomus]
MRNEDSTVEILRPVFSLSNRSSSIKLIILRPNKVILALKENSQTHGDPSMIIKSIVGSLAENPSPCESKRRADHMLGYSTLYFVFVVIPPETGTEITVNMIDRLSSNHGHCIDFVLPLDLMKDLLKHR